MTSTEPELANLDSNRESFLNMVAERLGRTRHRPWDIVHPDLGPHPAGSARMAETQPQPASESKADSKPDSAVHWQTEELVERFVRVFESQKGFAVRANGTDGVHLALSNIIEASNVKQAVLWNDERIDQFHVFDHLQSQGVTAYRWPGGERREADDDVQVDGSAWTKLAESSQIGITWADGVCAETGTVLLQNRGGHGRLVSLLPRHHIVVFTAKQIVPRLTELMAELHRLAQCDALPAYTNLIAGPSGSADIAMEYIQGVHGPGTVTAIIVEEEV